MAKRKVKKVVEGLETEVEETVSLESQVFEVLVHTDMTPETKAKLKKLFADNGFGEPAPTPVVKEEAQ